MSSPLSCILGKGKLVSNKRINVETSSLIPEFSGSPVLADELLQKLCFSFSSWFIPGSQPEYDCLRAEGSKKKNKKI